MSHPDIRPHASTAIGVIALGVLAVLAALLGWDATWIRALSYASFTLLPGAALRLSIGPKPSFLELFLFATIGGAVLIPVFGTLAILGGAPPGSAAIALLLISVGVASTRLLKTSLAGWGPGMDRRQLLILAGTAAVFCILAGYLPLRDEWWRYWSDAWFHGAVVHEIHTYGLPPKDPYFVGLDLQYMWMYHVFVLELSTVTHINAMAVMPLINLNALLGFIIASYLVATFFRPGFVYGLCGVLVAVLGLNAIGWAFLPLKALRAMTGDVRGWAEIARTYDLTPFNNDTVWTFLRVYYNQTFLLNKFIVSTAFSFGLCFMAGYWFGCLVYIRSRNTAALVLTFLCAIGMLTFHSLVGFMMLSGLFGACVLMWLLSRLGRPFPLASALRLCLTSAAALLLCAPYLYSVMHLKESEQLFPFSLMATKTGGIIISCALVLVLAWRKLRPLWGERTAYTDLFLVMTLVITVLCNLITLPGPNTFDKLPFFVFFPLAIVGSWVFGERLIRTHATARYRREIAVIMALILLPINAFGMLAYNNTTTTPALTPDQRTVSEWVQDNTLRDDIFFESEDRVLLLLTGPRRYYWGRQAYADQWGYPREEMVARRNVRDNLFSDQAPDGATLSALRELNVNTYMLIHRSEESTLGKVARFPAFFTTVFRTDELVVVAIDTGNTQIQEGATRGSR